MPGYKVIVQGATSTVCVKPRSSGMNPRNPWCCCPSCHWASQSHSSLESSQSLAPGNHLYSTCPLGTGQMLCLPSSHSSISVTHRAYLSLQKGVRKSPGSDKGSLCPGGREAAAPFTYQGWWDLRPQPPREHVAPVASLGKEEEKC